MIILAAASTLIGIALGLHVRVHVILSLAVAAGLLYAVMAVAGTLTFAEASLRVTVTATMLQVGYFVAVLLQAMRLHEEPRPATIATAEAQAMPHNGHRQLS